MYPNINVFGYNIGTYSICAVIGMIAAVLYVKFSVGKRIKYDSVQIINVAVVSGLGVFLGAHLLFAVTKWETLITVIADPGDNFSSPESAIQTFISIFGGMVFYGGLIGGLIAGFWYIRNLKHIKLDPWFYADIYAPAIPLFHVFGRIGCFLGGCCYGMESRWGFVYHSAPVPESNGVVRLPIQLFEAAGNLILFFFLHQMSKKPHSKGTLILTYLIIYPVMRFIIEFFRGDEIRGMVLGLSTSQWISIGLILFSTVFLFRRKNIKDEPAAA